MKRTKPNIVARMGAAAVLLLGTNAAVEADGGDELIGAGPGAYSTIDNFTTHVNGNSLPESVIPASGKNGEQFEIDPELFCEYDGTIFGYAKVYYLPPVKDSKIIPPCELVPVLGKGSLFDCYRQKVVKGGMYVREQWKWKNQAKISGKTDSKTFDGKTSVKVGASAKGSESYMTPLSMRAAPSGMEHFDATGGLSAGSMGKGKVSDETYLDMSTTQRLQYLGIIGAENRQVDPPEFKKTTGELKVDLDDFGVMHDGKVQITNKEPDFDKNKPGQIKVKGKGQGGVVSNTGLHWIPTSAINQHYSNTGCLFDPNWSVFHPSQLMSTHTSTTKWIIDPYFYQQAR